MPVSQTHLSLVTNAPTIDITAIRTAKIFCSDPDTIRELGSEVVSSLVHEACTNHLKMFLAGSPAGKKDKGWRKHRWRAIVRPDGDDRLSVTVISTPRSGTTDFERYTTRWSVEDYDVDHADTEVVQRPAGLGSPKDGTGRKESLLSVSSTVGDIGPMTETKSVDPCRDNVS